MQLAWRNIVHDHIRFLVAVLGIAFAVCLMVFQGGLLFGFLAAAAKLVNSTESDIWITARGVVCFDFPAPLSARFIELSRSVPGVDHASRIITAFAEYRKPNGHHQPVALVGADPDVGPEFPIPRLDGSGAAVPEAVLVDGSNATLLGINKLPLEVEINERRALVLGETAGFSSFLGSPYVFTTHRNAARYLGLNHRETMYILLRLREGFSPQKLKHELQARLTDADVWTRPEFARRSQLYWMTQTGAGGGILTAAVLGFLIGLVVVSQTMYATTMENLEEFATLKALGASRWFIRKVVLTQALVCGIAGAALGMGATFSLVNVAQRAIPWIQIPVWLPLVMVPASLGMCCLAAVASVRTAVSVDPAKVFRA